MTGYTSGFSLPYPEGEDAVAVHADLEILAKRVDVEVGGLQRTNNERLYDQDNRITQTVNLVGHLEEQVDGIHGAVAESATHAADSAASASDAWNANTALIPRVEHIETLAGLAPGEVTDAQTANLISQDGTDTRDALTGVLASRDVLVNVRHFGATGNGTDDDTAAIQAAIDYVSNQFGGGTVFIPQGTYMIKAHVDHDDQRNNLLGEGGIQLADNINLTLSPAATLKAFPNDKRAYNIVQAYNKHNIVIQGGRFVGERYEHTGSEGQWGHGIHITGGRNIIIRDTHISDMWGDGVYNNDYQGAGRRDPTVNFTMERVVCDNNRRQGLSITRMENGVIRDCTFKNTYGHPPEAGIDIEPSVQRDEVKNILIDHCVIEGNAGPGFTMRGENIRDIVVRDCVVKDNRKTTDFVVAVGERVHVSRVQVSHGVRISNANDVVVKDSEMQFVNVDNTQRLVFDSNLIEDQNQEIDALFDVIAYNGDWGDIPPSHVRVVNNIMCGGNDAAIRINDGSHYTFKNNIIEDCPTVISGRTPHVKFEGNTVRNSERSFTLRDAGWHIINNVFEGVPADREYATILNTPGGEAPGGAVIVGNIAYTHPIEPSDRQLGRIYGATDVVQSPNNEDDYLIENNFFVDNS